MRSRNRSAFKLSARELSNRIHLCIPSSLGSFRYSSTERSLRSTRTRHLGRLSTFGANLPCHVTELLDVCWENCCYFNHVIVLDLTLFRDLLIRGSRDRREGLRVIS